MLTPLVLALVAAAPTVQQKHDAVVLTPAQRLAAVLSNCFAATPDQSKTLQTGKKSVSIAVPNATVLPNFGGDPPPPDECPGGYIVQIEAPASSTPPPGYGRNFDITVTVSGQWTPKESCQAFESNIGIYKVKSDGTLDYKGGGSFTATWNESADPDTCDVVVAPGWESVGGSLPDTGTAKWRVIVRSGGNVTVKATRRKS